MTKRRVDLIVVERGLASSRQAARALIMSGRVLVEGRPVDKPGASIDETAAVTVSGPAHPYVGRGGVKLAGALDALGLEVSGLFALDVGSSTGGFTDCLLQRGAAKVACVDVGRGQLDWRLRNDPRVQVIEGLNARHLSPGDLGAAGRPDMATIDVSFISLRLVLPRVVPLVRRPEAGASGSARGSILALVKPQFEVGRGAVGKGGIVRDRGLRKDALARIGIFALSLGAGVAALLRSPIAGAEGNIEYFIHVRTEPGGLTAEEIEAHALRLSQEEPG